MLRGLRFLLQLRRCVFWQFDELMGLQRGLLCLLKCSRLRPQQKTLCKMQGGLDVQSADVSYDLEHPRDLISRPLFDSKKRNAVTVKQFPHL